MKLHLVTKQLKSRSLRLLSQFLSEKLGYKVWRSSQPKPNRKNILYGDCKGKIEQYAWFKEQNIPALEYTTSHETALQWLNDGITVVCRKLTHSSEGKGIVVAETPEQLCMAPVYTQYKKKKREFRVHIYQDQVVAVLEKRKKSGLPSVESRIRNTANGYVFCRQDVVEPDGLRELALKAAKITSSAFKGVDIGYNEKFDHLFVIEVNSAPGMEGTTIVNYAEAML